MPTIYTIDDNGLYAGAVTPGDTDLPPVGVELMPPALTGRQVARWVGVGWEVMDPYTAFIDAKWRGIKAERDRRKASGVRAGANWFHSDADSRIQQLALLVMGANVPPVPWKTLDGSFVTMTPTLALQIFQATAASDMALFAASETHLAALKASASPDGYDFSAGWPAAHGDAT